MWNIQVIFFSIIVTTALFTASTLADDSDSRYCAVLKDIFIETAKWQPCVWQACPGISPDVSASCSNLADSFKRAGDLLPCIFDVCPSNGGNGDDDSSINDDDSIETIVIDSDDKPTPNDRQPFIGLYFPNWFVYKKHYMGPDNMAGDGKFVGDPTDTSTTYFVNQMRDKAPTLTHIFYAFYNLNEECRVVDSDPDASWYGKGSEPTWIQTPSGACKGIINQMMSLKTEFPHLKLVISVGGWTYSHNFYHCTDTSEKRKFIYQSFDYYARTADPKWGKDGGLIDGVDFDWEHPSTNDGLVDGAWAENDWANYAALVEDFRKLARGDGRTKVQILSAIGVGNTLKRLVTDFRSSAVKFCANVDYVNLMTYDMHGKWDKTTGHNAPFCTSSNPNQRPDPTLHWSVVETAKMLGDVCGYAKINLGLPNYAPAWTGIEDNGVNGLYQTTTQDGDNFARWSTYSDSDTQLVSQGQIHFWDMQQTLSQYSDFRVHTAYKCEHLDVIVPVQFVYSAARQAFASFESVDVIKAKVMWARKRGFAGFFFWDASQDRYGDALATAVEAWGDITPKKATGAAGKCYDGNKPDFNSDPITGEPYVPGCFTNTERSTIVRSGSTCNTLGAEAREVCGGKAFAVGGQRQGMSNCVMPCAYDWSAGDVMLWSSDTIYYVCDLEELKDLGDGTGSAGISGSGTDCPACGACIAGRNNQGVTDATCQQCMSGQSYWPCNTKGLCGCPVR